MIATIAFALAAAAAGSAEAAPPPTLVEWIEAKEGERRDERSGEPERNQRCRLYNCGMPLLQREPQPRDAGAEDRN